MPPSCHVQNLLDLNASNDEGEANTSTFDVLRAIAQQLMAEIAQNPSGRNCNNSEESCTFEQFNLMHPPSFDGRSNLALAED